MDRDIFIEIVRIALPLLWTLIVAFMLFRYRRQLEHLVSRVGSIRVLGVQAEFEEAREQLLRAAQSYDLSPNEQETGRVIRRADRIRGLLAGSRILWVDDQFLTNSNIHRFLNSYGVTIDRASTTDEVLAALKWSAAAYEAVITDMVRGDDQQAGISLLEGIRELGIRKPVIIFVGNLDRSKGTPAGAMAITDNPIELIHYFMDVLEREDGSKGS